MRSDTSDTIDTIDSVVTRTKGVDHAAKASTFKFDKAKGNAFTIGSAKATESLAIQGRDAQYIQPHHITLFYDHTEHRIMLSNDSDEALTLLGGRWDRPEIPEKVPKGVKVDGTLSHAPRFLVITVNAVLLWLSPADQHTDPCATCTYTAVPFSGFMLCIGELLMITAVPFAFNSILLECVDGMYWGQQFMIGQECDCKVGRNPEKVVDIGRTREAEGEEREQALALTNSEVMQWDEHVLHKCALT